MLGERGGGGGGGGEVRGGERSWILSTEPLGDHLYQK